MRRSRLWCTSSTHASDFWSNCIKQQHLSLSSLLTAFVLFSCLVFNMTHATQLGRFAAKILFVERWKEKSSPHAHCRRQIKHSMERSNRMRACSCRYCSHEALVAPADLVRSGVPDPHWVNNGNIYGTQRNHKALLCSWPVLHTSSQVKCVSDNKYIAYCVWRCSKIHPHGYCFQCFLPRWSNRRTSCLFILSKSPIISLARAWKQMAWTSGQVSAVVATASNRWWLG